MGRPKIKPRYKYATPRIFDCTSDTFIKRRFFETKNVIKRDLKSLERNLNEVKQYMAEPALTQENLDEINYFISSMLNNSDTLLTYLCNNIGLKNGIAYA